MPEKYQMDRRWPVWIDDSQAWIEDHALLGDMKVVLPGPETIDKCAI